MRSALLSAPGKPLEIVEREVPEPGPGEILVEVTACGMCFSEVNHLRGHYAFGTFPVVPGHEISGVVAALGPGVEWPEVGTRVGAAWPYGSCGHCDQCVRGDQNLCGALPRPVTGVNRDGGYAEYFVGRAGFVTPLPGGLDPVAGAPLMCAGVTAFNGLRRAGAVAGSRVAVLGTGGVGMLAVRFAAAMGARVAAVSRTRSAEEEALRGGAELYVATSEQDPAEALRAWGGADVVMNTAPDTATGLAAFGGLRADGTLVYVGFDAANVEVSPLALVANRLRVMGTPSGSPADLRDTLDFAVAHGIVPAVTAVRLDDAPRVLAEMDQGRRRGRTVITFG
ncbi:alcohol dehydrogenase catalytic domain-containing protein [Actinomadura livida]|uniref:alcohol dehydrogenase n=1 Tax=Actinomadura livida TaxID=79909 RepID=A0A7W7ICU5_9ACTN|nr:MULTISPECIES: alcohol dehydrogenase catalytic domain-containing protein [Actinomadura]MBB4774363.1 D-arabinose 1-dehydrogenase-like Zn-dependent alcohol dehydrogenase [Actinomadura catellatispora]GGT83097.1 alcohol dehydrogenase [Actinomadura livida]